MLGKIGLTQILVIFGVFMVFFGYKKLPELGRNLGKGLKDFRKATHEDDDIDITPHKAE